MAIRKPLVYVAGQINQLPSGDTVDAPQSGGDVVALLNDEAAPVVIGTIVYPDASGGFKKARADAAGTKDVIGLVKDASITNGVSGIVQVNGPMDFGSTAAVDAVFGTTGGFTFKTRYYLSPTTAGLGTATAPTTVGQFGVPVGIALSTTILELVPFTPIGL